MCYTQALWWVRLRPGSDDSSRLGACLWVQRVFVLTLVSLSWSGGAPCLGMFAIADLFCSCLERIETKYCGRGINLIICVPIIKLPSLHVKLELPWGNVEHLDCCGYTWILFHRWSWWFHCPVLQESLFLSFMFSLTYKVAANLLSLHMAFYSSCDLLHDLMQLYSNWLPSYFFMSSPINQSCLPEVASGWLG